MRLAISDGTVAKFPSTGGRCHVALTPTEFLGLCASGQIEARGSDRLRAHARKNAGRSEPVMFTFTIRPGAALAKAIGERNMTKERRL